jgi:hypothetical protein
MNPPAFDTQRRMVPRWRSLATTLQARELGCPIKADRSKLGDHVTPPDLLTRLERWRLTPDLVTAAELVEACIVEGREREAVDAARRLVTIDRNAAPLIREQAAKLLQRTGHGSELTDSDRPNRTLQVSPRFFLKLHPHDPLAWVELALAQTIRGGAKPGTRQSACLAIGRADVPPSRRSRTRAGHDHEERCNADRSVARFLRDQYRFGRE